MGRCVSNHDHPANHPAIAFSRPRSIMFYNSAIETNGNCLFWIYGNPGESRNHVPHKLLAMEGSPRNRVLSGLCGQCQSESLAKLCKLWGFTGNIFQNMLHCETPQKILKDDEDDSGFGTQRLGSIPARIPIQQVPPENPKLFLVKSQLLPDKKKAHVFLVPFASLDPEILSTIFLLFGIGGNCPDIFRCTRKSHIKLLEYIPATIPSTIPYQN